MATGITTEAALFNHFVKFGIFEGRACCEGFNVAAYKSSYSDLQAAFGDDIVAYYVHYVTFGQTEKRALVTVEAATAAGVTVKSAADGAVVAAGAAKPAAGGAASSGSAASTNGNNNNSNSAGGTSSVTRSFKQNNAGVATDTFTEGKTEARFAAGIDYDYAEGEFYNYTKPKVDTTWRADYANDIVQVGTKYYTVIDADRALSGSDYYVVGENKIINTKARIDDNTADGLYKLQGWYHVPNIGWFHVANGREQYVSGNTWNVKTVYHVWNFGNSYWDSVLVKDDAMDTLGRKYTASDYIRKGVSPAVYYTTYHASADGATVSDKVLDNGMTLQAYFGGRNIHQALHDSYLHINYYYNVKAAADGFVYGETKDNYYNDELHAYEKVTDFSKACDLVDGYTEYVCDDNVKRVVVDATLITDAQYAAGARPAKTLVDGYYENNDASVAPVGVYKIEKYEVGLKALGYELFNDGAKYTYNTVVSNNYFGTAQTRKWLCYKPSTMEVDDLDTATVKEEPIKPTNGTYIKNAWDSTYYPVEKTSTNIWRDSAVYKQNTADNRFYK